MRIQQHQVPARIRGRVGSDQGEHLRVVIEVAGVDRTQVGSVVATGYGRNRVAFASTSITEIRCHARGVHHIVPDARSIVFMGGVALQPGMVRTLVAAVGCSIHVAREPQFTGALGAAILASRKQGAA